MANVSPNTRGFKLGIIDSRWALPLGVGGCWGDVKICAGQVRVLQRNTSKYGAQRGHQDIQEDANGGILLPTRYISIWGGDRHLIYQTPLTDRA